MSDLLRMVGAVCALLAFFRLAPALFMSRRKYKSRPMTFVQGWGFVGLAVALFYFAAQME